MNTGWTPFERERRRWVEELGYPTLLNVRRRYDPQLRVWAEATQRFVYIGRATRGGYRTSKWHNPYPLRAERDRVTVLAQYRQYLLAQPALLAALPELAGKVLGCWCLPKPCHGSILIELCNPQAWALLNASLGQPPYGLAHHQ
jgi:Domain of unknown function (DUF4326)